MSSRVSVEVGYAFDVRAPLKEVFALLADVPASAAHYPQLECIVPQGPQTWRWEMQSVGVGQFTLQTVYASRYTIDKAQGRISWEPVPDVGNAQVAGHWQVSKSKEKGRSDVVQLELNVQLSVQLPVPPLMQLVVTPLLQAEFERLTEGYIDSLIEHWGGEA